MCTSFIASSLAQFVYTLQRITFTNLETLHIIFAISTLFFFILLIWYIVAAVSNRRQEEFASVAVVSPQPIIPIDPFVKSELSNYIEDTESSIISSNDISGGSSYLISSSAQEEEVDLLEVESKLYDFSIDKKDGFFYGSDSSLSESTSNTVEYGYSSDIEREEEEFDRIESDSSYISSFPEKKDKISRETGWKDGNAEYKEKTKADYSGLPDKSYKDKIPSKHAHAIDLPVADKSFSREKAETISPVISQKQESSESLKIKLPKKEVILSKAKEEEDLDNSRTRTAPLKAMRIDLPEKGKITLKKKVPEQLESKKGRIDLPKKSLQ